MPKPASERYVTECFVGISAQCSDYYAWRLCALGTGQSICVNQSGSEMK